MPRIQVHGPASDPLVAAVYSQSEADGGSVPGWLKVLSAGPRIMQAAHQLSRRTHGQDSRLGERLVHLIAVRISSQNRCEYGIDLHGRALAEAAGITPGAALALAAETGRPAGTGLTDGPAGSRTQDGRLSAREEAVLAYVDRFNRNSAAARKEHVEALREAGLTDEEILEVTWVAGMTTWMNRVALALGVEPDADRVAERVEGTEAAEGGTPGGLDPDARS